MRQNQRVRWKLDPLCWGFLRALPQRPDGIAPELVIEDTDQVTYPAEATVVVQWIRRSHDSIAGWIEDEPPLNEIEAQPDHSALLATIPELSTQKHLTLPQRLHNETDDAYNERTLDIRTARDEFLAARMVRLREVVAEMDRLDGRDWSETEERASVLNLTVLNGMVEQGVFDGIHHDGTPIQPAPVISVGTLGAQATMAHVMALLKVFPSVGQARKNGWDKPITLGHHTLTKKRIRVNIVP